MFFKSWKNTLFLSSTWEKSAVETAQNWDRYMSELATSFVCSCVSLSCIKGKVVGGKMWLLRCKLIWTTSLSVTSCLLLDVLCFTSPALAALGVTQIYEHYSVNCTGRWHHSFRGCGCYVTYDLSHSALYWPLVIFVEQDFCSDTASWALAVSDWELRAGSC